MIVDKIKNPNAMTKQVRGGKDKKIICFDVMFYVMYINEIIFSYIM